VSSPLLTTKFYIPPSDQILRLSSGPVSYTHLTLPTSDLV